MEKVLEELVSPRTFILKYKKGKSFRKQITL